MSREEELRYDQFQKLLERLESGEPLQKVTARLEGGAWADDDEDLAWMLATVTQIKTSIPPVPDATAPLARARTRVLAAQPAPLPAALAPQPIAVRPAPARRPSAPPSWWERMRQRFGTTSGWGVPAWATTAAVMFMVLAISLGVGVRASADALPGQPLYAIKITAEKVGTVFTLGAERQAERAEILNALRIREIGEVIERGWSVEVSYRGIVIGREGKYWRVGDFLVDFGAAEGDLPAGSVIQVTGVTDPDGVIRSASWHWAATATPAPTLAPTNTTTPEPMLPGMTLDSHATDTPAPVTPLRPTLEPLPKATLRPTRTPRPTSTATATLTPAPTRPIVYSVVGTVTDLSADRIAVNGESYLLTEGMDLTGVRRGVRVALDYRVLPNGQKIAINITLQGTPVPTETVVIAPQRFSATGIVQRLSSSEIILDTGSFRVAGNIEYVGNPAEEMDAVVEGYYGEDGVTQYADRLTAIEMPPTVLDGLITAIDGRNLVIRSTIVNTRYAQMTGVPVVGLWAEVSGDLRSDGVVLARMVRVVLPTPTHTPRVTPGSSPTSTATLLAPTPTATPSPTPTAPSPTATFTPQAPTATPTEILPTPTATVIPPTNTPEPTATPTAIPPTNTPIPEATPTTTATGGLAYPFASPTPAPTVTLVIWPIPPTVSPY